jgi:putative hydrolase of the HAD superfamily
MLKGKFTHIFFDADDTLWENERFFREAEVKFIELLSDYTGPEGVREMLWHKQELNIPIFGYGSKTYLLGMTEAALDICGGKIEDRIYKGIKDIIIELAYHEFDIIKGVEETLKALHKRYTLVVATKGDLTEQLSKYRRSGLDKYFHHRNHVYRIHYYLKHIQKDIFHRTIFQVRHLPNDRDLYNNVYNKLNSF